MNATQDTNGMAVVQCFVNNKPTFKSCYLDTRVSLERYMSSVTSF